KNRLYDSIFSYDRSKLIISVKNTKINGKQLFDILYNDYNIVLEMYSDTYVIAMLSMCDKLSSIKRLIKALHRIDNMLDGITSHNREFTYSSSVLPEAVMRIRDAKNSKNKIINLEKSEGHISNEFIWAYPPGIPYLIPGEIITSDIIVQIKKAIDNGIDIKSDLNHKRDEISVIN
ncbi:MAG: decarboxylase, partial [Clostridia bacterium]|nr:decarboxylase [Clostridia bacterium]